MSDLPLERVIPNNPPFTFTGVDYFGPMLVKQKRSQVKRWGCLFTCLTTRAIHLEIAHSLDTSSFICALRRFVSRRGNVKVIRSDQGTNFQGANKELKEEIKKWNQNEISKNLQQQQIEWKFNPPSAPHHGGVWERLVRSVKEVLKQVGNEQKTTDEGLLTVFAEVENIVNGRPLTPNTDDPSEAEPLTPNHLLMLHSNNTLPPGIFHKNDIYTARRWKQVQYLCDLFWKRWLREYLPLLQKRQKWYNKRPNIQVGDVVLMVDDSQPRGKWPLARVIDVFPGADGLVRTVKLKTSTTELIRPISRLVSLEGVID